MPQCVCCCWVSSARPWLLVARSCNWLSATDGLVNSRLLLPACSLLSNLAKLPGAQQVPLSSAPGPAQRLLHGDIVCPNMGSVFEFDAAGHKDLQTERDGGGLGVERLRSLAACLLAKSND